MRRVPHPVMIVTAKSPRKETVGLLVSSFNTVSLYSRPVVSFNLKLPSSTFDAIAISGLFTVNATSTLKLARAFAKASSYSARLSETNTDTLNPCLDRSLFQMTCDWWKEKSVEVEDHMIMVGRVLAINHNSQQRDGRTALIYSEGKYRNAGEPLEETD